MAQVSVIIPAFNAAAFVAEAIDSVLAQTMRDFEIIVVNDGSTDETARLLSSYDGRITVVNQANHGLAAARNKGAAVARGEWLAFLDADDLWHPDKLQLQLAIAGPNDHFSYTDRLNIGDRGPLPLRQGDLQPGYEGDVFEQLLVVGNILTASSVMMRRRQFELLEGFCVDLQAAEDWDLWIRFAADYPMKYHREPLVSYRFHSSMMSGDPAKMAAARTAVVRRALDLPRARRLSPAVKRRIWSTTFVSNGWDAGRHARRPEAIEYYLRAIERWPFAVTPYRELVKTCVGR